MCIYIRRLPESTIGRRRVLETACQAPAFTLEECSASIDFIADCSAAVGMYAGASCTASGECVASAVCNAIIVRHFD